MNDWSGGKVRIMGEMRKETEVAKEYYEYDPDANELKAVSEKVAKKGRGIFSGVDKWKVFKQVVGMVASGCASVVINRYLRANMPQPANTFETVVNGVGTYFITGVVGATVSKYAEQELDEWRDSVMIAKEAADGSGKAE